MSDCASAGMYKDKSGPAVAAMLSRAVTGTRRNCLILDLPGSERAARENLSAVLGALDHGLKMIAGGGH